MDNKLDKEIAENQAIGKKPSYTPPKLVTIDVSGKTFDTSNDSTHPTSAVDGSGS